MYMVLELSVIFINDVDTTRGLTDYGAYGLADGSSGRA